MAKSRPGATMLFALLAAWSTSAASTQRKLSIPNLKRIECGAVRLGWTGRVSETEVGWTGDLLMKNTCMKPVQKVAIRIKYTGMGGETHTVDFGTPSFQSDNAVTDNVLLPGFWSRPIHVECRLPISMWSQRMDILVEVYRAEEFEYRSNLHEPLKLMTFIYLGTTKEVLDAFDKDKSLLKVKTDHGVNVAMMAAMQNDVAMLKGLVARGANIRAVTEGKVTALHYASMSTPELVQYVASQGVKSTVTRTTKSTPLEYAVQHHNPLSIKALAKAGVPLSTKNSLGNTPLMSAIWIRSPECIQALLESGASLSDYSAKGDSVMGVAAASGREDVMEMLLRKGAGVNARDPKTGRTPLHTAVENGAQFPARWLIRHGAKSNIKDAHGETAEDVAANLRHPVDRATWARIFKGG